MAFALPNRTAALVPALTLALGLAHARAQSSQPPQTTEAALQAMTDAAGVIFTGTVTAVRRPAPEAAPGGVVEIDFAVTDAIRGVTGNTYTLREWSGLWQANDEPFQAGQRYLMLLHAPNPAGLSSPVGGTDGAIPIHGSGSAALADGTATVLPRTAGVHGTAQSPRETTGGVIVDLGWIATHVVVPVAYSTALPVRPVHLPTVHAQASPAAQTETQAVPQNGFQTSSQAEAATQSTTGLPAALPADVRASSYTAVVQKLRAWELERSRNVTQ